MNINEDPYEYSDLVPLNYKSKTNLVTDLDDILKWTSNVTGDWKKRESSIRKIGSITIGNMGKNDYFVKFLNQKLSANIGFQLADLRTTVMKEACRICSLCALELGELMEPAMTHLLSHHVLFKIAGSANRVIADNTAICILNIVRYIHSYKGILNICEQKTVKSNAVRIIAANCLYFIMGFYNSALIMKSLSTILNTLKSFVSDANPEVRSISRKAILVYKRRFEEDAINFIDSLEKNAKKQIFEDEKNIKNIDLKYNPSADQETKNSYSEKKKENMKYGSVKAISSEIQRNINYDLNKEENDDNNEEYYQINKQKTINNMINQNNRYNFGNLNNVSAEKHSLKLSEKKNKSSCKKDLYHSIEKKNNKNLKESKDEQEQDIKLSNTLNPKKLKLNKSSNLQRIQIKQNNKEEEYAEEEEEEDNQLVKKNILKTLNQKLEKLNILVGDNEKNEVREPLKMNVNVKKEEKKNPCPEIENKMNMLLDNLKKVGSKREQLVIFQYLFNDFNETLEHKRDISKLTLRKYIDMHIEFLANDEKHIVDQVIKNLMRMFFYMSEIFCFFDVESVSKMLQNYSKSQDRVLSKLSKELMEIINKKFGNNDNIKHIV